MKFDLPVKEDFLLELNTKLQNGDISIYKNKQFSSIFCPYDVPKGTQAVEFNGGLEMVCGDQPFAKFNGVEVNNDRVYMVGVDVKTGSRLALTERVNLSLKNTGVVVSSHVEYADALDFLSRGLKSCGCTQIQSLDKAISGGFLEDFISYSSGGKGDIRNALGFTGLLGLAESEDNEEPNTWEYCVLLHDTCGVDPSSFVESMGNIDVGLGQDIIFFNRDSLGEIGVYRVDFILSIISQLQGSDLKTLRSEVANSATVYTNLRSSVSNKGVKDIYGKGNSRKILTSSLGLSKYESDNIVGGTP